MSIVTVSATFCFFTFVAAQAPIQFGLDNGDVGQRGLLATHLNKNPIGNESSGKLQEGRRSRRSHCCCISSRASCPGGGGGGGGSGGFIDFINPRDNLNRDGDTSTDPRSAGSRGDVTLRIVNRPVDDGPARGRNCRAGQQQCCYRNKKQLRRVSRTCTPITTAPQEHWQQGCREDLVRDGGQQCGRRNPEETVTVRGAEAKPNEFPWTCLLLNGNNDFLGSCAIVPSGRSNDISGGTDRVITAAHKLKDVQSGTLIKVRVLEYDARGFRRPETREHQEYVVRRFKLHPSYDPTRLSYDVAVLYLDRSIPLRNNPGVNAACFPPCSNMFDHRFSNGTGTRCWVAGWGKNEAGSRGKFQPIQNKVDVPLYPRGQCESAIRAAFRKRNKVAATNNFVLDPSELCAGGEQGKDACEGDGGSPLVCRSDTDTWYVVGIVTWGVGCADKNVPGVYANVYRMLDFITSRG